MIAENDGLVLRKKKGNFVEGESPLQLVGLGLTLVNPTELDGARFARYHHSSFGLMLEYDDFGNVIATIRPDRDQVPVAIQRATSMLKDNRYQTYFGREE